MIWISSLISQRWRRRTLRSKIPRSSCRSLTRATRSGKSTTRPVGSRPNTCLWRKVRRAKGWLSDSTKCPRSRNRCRKSTSKGRWGRSFPAPSRTSHRYIWSHRKIVHPLSPRAKQRKGCPKEKCRTDCRHSSVILTSQRRSKRRGVSPPWKELYRMMSLSRIRK